MNNTLLAFALFIFLMTISIIAVMVMRHFKQGESLSVLLDGSLVPLYGVHEGKVIYVNQAMCNLLGYQTKQELLGRPAADFTAIEDMALFQEMHRKRLAGELKEVDYVYRAVRKDGQLLPIRVTGGVVPVNSSKDSAVIGMAFDARKYLDTERQLKLSHQVYQAASEGIIVTDADFRVESVNPAFTKITGYAESEAVGKISALVRPTHLQGSTQGSLLATLMEKGRWEGELIDRRKNGEHYPTWLSISPIFDDKGRTVNWVYVFTDHTTRKAQETRLIDMASKDGLTGLLNRDSLVESLDKRIDSEDESLRRLTVFFIDLDHFKGINDTLGHAAGDTMLKAVASRIQAVLRKEDVAARIGGDEFAVILDGTNDPETVVGMAQRILDSVVQPVSHNDHEIFVTASIGWASYPLDGATGDELLRNADMAMYQAKASGRNGFQAFKNDMVKQTHRRVLIENGIFRALENQEFSLAFQPKVQTESGRIVGAEALLRWKTPQGHFISPAEFIPIAENTGQIVLIGDWVLREACAHLQQWRSMGLPVGRIAVNLSPRQLVRDQFIPNLLAALREHGVGADELELEITEGTILTASPDVISTLKRLKTMGMTLAIDDFGTGYSSLSVLKHAPIDVIKIDKSFVHDLPTDRDNVAITDTIIAIAQKIGLSVVAEGVETDDQHQHLLHAGCDLVQGYLIGRPMSAMQFEDYLRMQESQFAPLGVLQ